jgi:hypothetical protein
MHCKLLQLKHNSCVVVLPLFWFFFLFRCCSCAPSADLIGISKAQDDWFCDPPPQSTKLVSIQLFRDQKCSNFHSMQQLYLPVNWCANAPKSAWSTVMVAVNQQATNVTLTFYQAMNTCQIPSYASETYPLDECIYIGDIGQR